MGLQGGNMSGVLGQLTQMEAAQRAALDQARLIALALMTCDAFGGEAAKVLTGAMDHRSRSARAVTVYLAHCHLGMTQQRVADVLGLNRSTVHRLVAGIETRRDEPAFNHGLEQLEALLTKIDQVKEAA